LQRVWQQLKHSEGIFHPGNDSVESASPSTFGARNQVYRLQKSLINTKVEILNTVTICIMAGIQMVETVVEWMVWFPWTPLTFEKRIVEWMSDFNEHYSILERGFKHGNTVWENKIKFQVRFSGTIQFQSRF
jgi:hypothetical protein